MMHPRHHQSTGFPWPYFFITSGAKYSGVPQIDIVGSSAGPIAFDKPKSVSFKYPVLSSKTFSGLRLL